MTGRTIGFGTLLFFAATLAAGCGADGRAPYLSIGTGGTGGIYYPLGGALASMLSTRDPDRRYTAEVSGGSVENVNRLANRQTDIAFGIGTTIYEAYHGSEDFPRPVSGLRIVAPLYPNQIHVLVPRGAGITSVSELRGRRFSVGAPGSGNEQVARHLLEAHGMAVDDVQARYLSFAESAAALRDGALAGAMMVVGYPASAVLEATTAGDARLIGIEPEPLARLLDGSPYYIDGTIPAGVYRGVNEDIRTFAVTNWIIALEDLDDDVVHHILDILTEERERLIRVNEIVRQIDLASLRHTPIPLHPATVRWLEERGMPYAQGGAGD